jgi:hypothetical protein
MVIMFIFPAIASGDPGPMTRFLINEPASMLDFGLLRAQLYLNEVADTLEAGFSAQDSRVSVRFDTLYDYPNDKILLLGIVTSAPDTKEACRGLLMSPFLRGKVEVVVDNEPRGQMNTPTLEIVSQWFMHKGVRSTQEPENFDEEILKRIDVVCGDGNGLLARRALLDERIYWTEDDDE